MTVPVITSKSIRDIRGQVDFMLGPIDQGHVDVFNVEVSSRFVIFCTVDCTYGERRLGVSFS
jgi:hypothetical protein